MKKFFKITSCILFASIVVLYSGIVLVLPKVINSETVINKLEEQVFNKTGIESNITGLTLKVSPTLVLNLNINSIETEII